MGLNIKNARTEGLVKKLAAMAGEGQTEAITIAVEERIKRLSALKSERLARINAIVDRMAPYLQDMPDHGEFLYDSETGLPK